MNPAVVQVAHNMKGLRDFSIYVCDVKSGDQTMPEDVARSARTAVSVPTMGRSMAA
jgi:hypothetical protein